MTEGTNGEPGIIGGTTTRPLLRLEHRAGIAYVITREGSQKEFKENFTWGSIGSYARTMAAFANNRGGQLIFGVTDSPRIATGLSESGLSSFDRLDQARLTQNLNDLFSPEISWYAETHVVDGLTLGVITVEESRSKPILAKKNYQYENANVTEGDIFYRYNSRTERIKYPELREILEVAKTHEQRKMMNHITELVRAGASNAAVLDFSKGTLQGANGQTVLIDESLMERISFIKEGEFDEVAGAPALKVIGEVVPAKTLAVGPERIVPKALTSEDLILDFLTQASIEMPESYIRQAAASQISFLPVHYYRSLARLSNDELVELIEKVPVRSYARTKLIDRIRSEDNLWHIPPLPSSTHDSTIRRRAYYDQVAAGIMDGLKVVDEDDALYFLQVIPSLTDEQISKVVGKLLPVLKDCFDRYYMSDGRIADVLRRAICRIDIALYA